MFRSPEARDRVVAWAERFERNLSVSSKRFEVATSFGETRGLIAGPPDAPPLVVLHGALASSAHVLPQLGPLVESRRIIVVDVIGQSPFSADRRLDMDDDSYARWFWEVVGGLNLDAFDLLAVSWGGFVGVKAALANPDRIRKLVLVVPAGIVNGPAWKGFTKMGWPMMKFIKSPSEKNLQRVLEPLFTTRDAEWEQFFGQAIRDYRLDMRIPPLWKPSQTSSFTKPVLVFGADQDLSFPGNKLTQRARELFPQAETVLLENCKHCPPFTDEFRAMLAGKIEAFLA